MSSDNLGWIEIVFVGAAALGFGLWQLWSINREIRSDREKRDRAQKSAESGHLVGEHPLDDR